MTPPGGGHPARIAPLGYYGGVSADSDMIFKRGEEDNARCRGRCVNWAQTRPCCGSIHVVIVLEISSSPNIDDTPKQRAGNLHWIETRA
jgi:hypothetical protein